MEARTRPHADALLTLLKTRRVERWEVFFVPATAHSFTNISAETLEHQCFYRWTRRGGIRRRSQDKRLDSFLRTLEQGTATPTVQEADHRFGCAFYDKENKRVFRLCLDGSGRGTLQDRRVLFDKDMVRWFRQFAADHFS